MTFSELKRTWKRDTWVKPFFKQYRKVLALALFLGLVTFVFAAGLMFTSGYLISGAAEVPDSILVLNLPLIFVRIFGAGKPALQYLERLCSHDWVLRMTSGLRLKLYRVLEADALFFRATHRTGDVLGLLAEDIGHIQNLYLRTVFPTVIAYLLYFVLIAGLGFVSPFLALAMLLLLGVVVFLVPLVSVLVNGARRARYKEMRNELYAELTDNVLGVSDWVFAQRGDAYLSRYKSAERAMKEIARAEDRFDRARDLAAQAVFGVTAVVLVLWAGAHFGGQHGGAANWIAAFVLGFFPLIEAFAPLSSAAVDAFGYADSVARLNDLADPSAAKPAEEPPLPAGPLDIRLDGVSYAYPGSARSVLDDLTLHVGQGQKLAILGRSGAGKSTLATLVRGDVAPDAGAVTLGGVPCARFGDAMASYIGVIQQNTYLFNMTVLENLRIGRADATEEEVWDVLEQVGLRAMVERLPQGLSTMVDEAGLRFSGGERHRIALARVLLQDVPVVILDEPTVGLDPFTERALLDTVLRALDGKTVIMITHHLAGVGAMDRVVFLEHGRIELDGAPDELARTSERYRSLLAFDRGTAAG
ncbi:thiol reductant ABC exporter subunit CydC [Eggerthella sinensis]|uniref:Thiol reductant ABC exporter subunit CydC n=2 Tax=Eggerthella sinensis TaxID=242230 RepID=A0A3N0IWC3_9ACTN|nr:thiol reductant ABC exporter subunit CydC [Eggerthella sinensis]RDB69490.1 thiol reductant ABC exporter subunit CydC [Eggerthella sinensis]RNM40632.1 thiol reductant ABC exporter subunit CydC [Eggerthella sinensis]